MGGGDQFLEADGKNYPIYAPQKLKELEFDKLFVASVVDLYQKQILSTLADLGVSKDKIDTKLVMSVEIARRYFIKGLSLRLEPIKACVAELGVFRGETARYINHYFKNDDFYLFDTFEGFSEKDFEKERQVGGAGTAKSSDFSDTSLDFVKAQMPYLDKCHFIKGYFPQSTEQIAGAPVFKFVNIDVDLYQPILAGLEWFYPKMTKGGVILVHDYFHPFYTGAAKAVDEFARQNNLKFYPIGDAFSVFVVKD